jgi:iron complex outermembrane recepter protein
MEVFVILPGLGCCRSLPKFFVQACWNKLSVAHCIKSVILTNKVLLFLQFNFTMRTIARFCSMLHDSSQPLAILMAACTSLISNLWFLMLFFLCFPVNRLYAQDTAHTKLLGEIVLKGFESNRIPIETPAAITYISQQQLLRFNNASLLNAINTAPGVRMEERSPGSYRVSIRGSSLRSPFGVRNVKVYLNDIPFTEPGGTTYLNQLSFYTIQSVEILKGPSGSLYGAGNGGTLLLKTYGTPRPPGIGVDYTVGSFGMQNINLYGRLGNAKNQQTINYARLQSNGYRDWTKSRRDIVHWDGHFTLNKNQLLHTFLMYGDLFYQTPGGLTPQEFATNPMQARPAVGQFPASQQANASIRQKTLFAGISYVYTISEVLKNTIALYGAFSQIDNPAIRNYEKRQEPHAGGRAFFTYQPKKTMGELKLIAGMELQNGWYNVKVFKNKNGVNDTLQTEDKVKPFIWSSFVQADWKLPKGWVITVGASLTQNSISITRLGTLRAVTQKRKYTNEVAPRLALLKKVTETISLYSSVAKGFSPPTSAEVLPSTGIINTSLTAEQGWNYEGGIKANFFKNKLSVEVNSFFFGLHNTIVQRRDSSGADFFANAGATRQKGVEVFVKYAIATQSNKFIRNFNAWLSYTYSDFAYKDFKQLTNDYSGKQLPGVPKNMLVAGLDIILRAGAYVNLTYNYNGATPLNDANTFASTSFHLLNVRMGYKQISIGKMKIGFFAGADNLFNQTYSLGNDINAAANRFFNVAPARNYYIGISLFQQIEKNQSATGTSL